MRTGSIKYLALMGVVLSSCNHPSVQPVTEVKPTAQISVLPASQTNASAGIRTMPAVTSQGSIVPLHEVERGRGQRTRQR